MLAQCIDKVVPIRLEPHEELIGADLIEHRVKHEGVGVGEALAILKDHFDSALLAQVRSIGTNPGERPHGVFSADSLQLNLISQRIFKCSLP